MPSYHQSTRFYVYSLIDVLLSKQRKGEAPRERRRATHTVPALQAMGPEFLQGYCALAEGEKDPRNLKIGFAIDLVLLIEFDIEGATEDLFDISFCYFPITFTPPPDDPYGISSEELQVALRRVLAANPHFGPLALPLILDKLSASSKSAKVRPKDGAAGGLIPGVGAKP
jgi:DNA repair/transcription protein MET18/MMS19